MGMNLFDLLEMLLDWSAASAARSEKGLMDLEKSQEIHNIPRDLMIILENTAEFLQLNHVEDC
jgi:hypothetical protein